jgi:phage terminase large subunit
LLTDTEILELETLLKERDIDISRKALDEINEEANPNYKLLFQSIKGQEYNDDDELINGKRGCILEGSSRSGKTWSGVDIIIWLCLFIETKCTINIYRETYNEFKTTLYDDFKRRLDDFSLPNKFHTTDEVKSFKIGQNTIFFLGDGKHGGGCDYAFFNEMMHIKKSVFDQVEMRCRKFWWGDYNPSFTEHWVFDNIIPRPDIGFLRTTFNDNKFISVQERNKILSFEPWKPGSYIVKDSDILCYNKLTKKVEPISKTNIPEPHPTNITNWTADEFMWKVYGLGLRGAMKGVIFNYVEWIDKFPEMASIFTNDFGFTTDPNSLNRYAEDEHNIWIEPLCYEPIETSDELIEVAISHGIKPNTNEYKRDGDLIVCDSSDKYTGENKGTVEMVKALKTAMWNALKVSKTKSVMFWLLSMKSKKIHIVKNHLYHQVKKEKENYRLKEINGIAINQPIDSFNHFWDSARYGHMSYNSRPETHTTEESLSDMGINY